jgi:hypothetical protein
MMRDISTPGRFQRRVSIKQVPGISPALYSVELTSRWLDAKNPDEWQTGAKVLVDQEGLWAMREEIDFALHPPF